MLSLDAVFVTYELVAAIKGFGVEIVAFSIVGIVPASKESLFDVGVFGRKEGVPSIPATDAAVVVKSNEVVKASGGKTAVVPSIVDSVTNVESSIDVSVLGDKAIGSCGALLIG